MLGQWFHQKLSDASKDQSLESVTWLILKPSVLHSGRWTKIAPNLCYALMAKRTTKTRGGKPSRS